jgi:hypothetical protein
MIAKFNIKNSAKHKNPFPHSTLQDRLIKDKVIDMRDNYYVQNLNDSYVTINPIDKSKIFK